MDNKPRRKELFHDLPSWVLGGGFFFITICCDPRDQNHLCRPEIGNAVLEAADFYHLRARWFCRLMLLMPDHLHAILAFPDAPGMRSTISAWKRYLARKQGIAWQRDFFDHRLRSESEGEEKAAYILMNPVRAGLCKAAEEWPWVFQR